MTCDGVLPEDVQNIKMIYSVVYQALGQKWTFVSHDEEFCEMKKNYFSSNYVFQLRDVGVYKLRAASTSYRDSSIENFRILNF